MDIDLNLQSYEAPFYRMKKMHVVSLNMSQTSNMTSADTGVGTENIMQNLFYVDIVCNLTLDPLPPLLEKMKLEKIPYPRLHYYR